MVFELKFCFDFYDVRVDRQLIDETAHILDCIGWIHNKQGEGGDSEVERRTTGRGIEGSKPTPAVLCH